MEYVPFKNISKRNINQKTSNEIESFILSNKRTCPIEETKVHLSQNLKLHVNPAWTRTNNDFEYVTNSESMKHIQTHRTKGIPIIFHFASEEIMDLDNNVDTELPSIHSAVSLPTLSVDDFHGILRKKSSQSDRTRDHRTITGRVYEDKENDSLDQLKFNSTLAPSSLCSDRSLERLQTNYREYLVRRKEDMKSSRYQPLTGTVDAQAYVRCRKHRQLIPVQIIASDSDGKLCEFVRLNSLSQRQSNYTLSKTRRNKYKQRQRKSSISDLCL